MNGTILSAVLGGFTLATLAPSAAAQAQLPPADAGALYVSEFEVRDPEGIRPYSAAVEDTFRPFGGRYIVRGGQVTSLEGPATKRVVVIRFPSRQQAQAWYDSPAYRAIRPIRQQSATSKVFMVQAVASTASAPTQAGGVPASQEIARAGSQPSTPGPAQFFTGRVRVDPVWSGDPHLGSSGGLVTFEPGARSNWHTHPAGQRLVVTSGVGLTQEWGKPVQVIRPGDVIHCPPGVKHWHGAGPTTAMTHLAVTGALNGSNVNWMEKVTDEQYNAR